VLRGEEIARYLGGPDKGKFMDLWKSHFANGVEESGLTLSMNGYDICKSEGCIRASASDGWKFSLWFHMPKSDDPTQLLDLYFDGTCEENWLVPTEKSSPVVQPKDWAQQ
jgi:hypothetical protein